MSICVKMMNSSAAVYRLQCRLADDETLTHNGMMCMIEIFEKQSSVPFNEEEKEPKLNDLKVVVEDLINLNHH